MRKLLTEELIQVSAAKFKWHINPVHIFYSAVAGFMTAGPFGAGIAVGVAIAAQGTYQANDQLREYAHTMGAYPEYTLGR